MDQTTQDEFLLPHLAWTFDSENSSTAGGDSAAAVVPVDPLKARAQMQKELAQFKIVIQRRLNTDGSINDDEGGPATSSGIPLPLIASNKEPEEPPSEVNVYCKKKKKRHKRDRSRCRRKKKERDSLLEILVAESTEPLVEIHGKSSKGKLGRSLSRPSSRS